MLVITVPGIEMWDERKEEFVSTKDQTLQLEHSLISLSKWESKWCKPFFSKKAKTNEETLDYIKCMTLTPNISEDVYYRLTRDNYEQINKYIEAPMTATTFSGNKKGRGRTEIVTSELIYYWMIALNIPFECQKWHINRLLTLVEVCNIKNQPSKKMSKQDMINRNANMEAINRARRAKLGSKG